MKYYWKVLEWPEQKDVAKYCNMPIFIEDKLDETLDSGEVILMAMPKKDPYPPKFKFRLERYTDEHYTKDSNYHYWDMVVDHDDVQTYVGLEGRYTHRVSLIEASVIAQGMHVDNISLTYELQDVDLNYKTYEENVSKCRVQPGNIEAPNATHTYAMSDAAVTTHNEGDVLYLDKHTMPVNCDEFYVIRGLDVYGNEFNMGICLYDTLIIYQMELQYLAADQDKFKNFTFHNNYKYEWRNLDDLKAIRQKYDGMVPGQEIGFALPELWVCGHNGTEWVDLFQLNAKITIKRELWQGDVCMEISGCKETSTGPDCYLTGPTGIERPNKKYRLYWTGADGKSAGLIGMLAPFGCSQVPADREDTYRDNNADSKLREFIVKNETNYRDVLCEDDFFFTHEDDYGSTSSTIKPAKYWIHGEQGSKSEKKSYILNEDLLVTVKNEDKSDSVKIQLRVENEAELSSGKHYVYHIHCEPDLPDGVDTLITEREYVSLLNNVGWGASEYALVYNVKTKEKRDDASKLNFDVSFEVGYMYKDAGDPIAYLRKGTKYSCYDLLRKAMLTCDTQVIEYGGTSIDEYLRAADGAIKTKADGMPETLPSIEYPIITDKEWEGRLLKAQMYETVFEQKNLWEVLLQIGYYLHAIPYLEFDASDTDKFVLKFKQLGGTATNDDKSGKITVFSSINLSDYFTQYDSYVTNLFSPQNLIEEWVVPKTSDSSYLVSNDTAELQLKYPITEIVEFYISYNGGEERDALEYIFEESVYQVLTSDNPMRIKPAKGNALYYRLGSNVIGGFQYISPQVNPGDLPYAFKEICRRLFNTGADLLSNKLMFHIKYRTQDELRVTQFRPDLENFMKNSSKEQYPHHEQYYGQQDKIVDSERFSANLYGQLIRVGNAVYQRQEYAPPGTEKEAGDLVTIDNAPYYVTEIENEYYPDIIKQKVTYSKNFNQLSKIVTIPSEPRFYEVSERSKIRREVRIPEFFTLSTTPPPENVAAPRYLNNDTWKKFIVALIFNKENFELPNFAYTNFIADNFREHYSSGGHISKGYLFPSSEVKRDEDNHNSVQPIDSSDHADCIVPLLHFPLHDGIVFEWDMEDNFKAGDFVDGRAVMQMEKDATGQEVAITYNPLQSFRYCDIMGRADLFTFMLFNKEDWTHSQVQQLPKAVITPTGDKIGNSNAVAYLPKGKAIALDKDNREALSFNYQINLLHRPTEADTEDFITFPNLFGEKESPLKMCLMKTAQSKFSETIDVTSGIPVEYTPDFSHKNAIKINITKPRGVNLADVQSIVLYQETENAMAVFLAKNVKKDLPADDKLKSWWIYPVYTNE